MRAPHKISGVVAPGAPVAGGIEDFYALRLRSIWAQVKAEHFSFWMICGYLFVEYVRPQSIIPALDFLPWAQVFLLLSLIGVFSDRKKKWVADPVNKWLTLFLLLIVLSSALAVYPSISWDHIKDFVGWYIIYFMIVNIVNSERRLLVFFAIFIVASFKLSLFGAKTWALRGFAFTSWGLMGPPGFFQNSGELAIQMLMFSPIAYQLALFLRPYVASWKFYILIAIPITGAMTVMGASSRGGQIGLAYQAYRSLVKGRISFKTIVIVVAVVWAALALLPAEQKARFTSAGNDRTSQQRLLYWQHGIEMIKDHPYLGVGYFNFPAYYEANFPQDMLYEHAELPHNIFIQVGTDMGFTGLVVFLAILYRNFRSVRDVSKLCEKSDDPSARLFTMLAAGLGVALWGFILAGQFVTVTYYPFLWVNLALTVSLRNIASIRFGATSTTSASIVRNARKRPFSSEQQGIAKNYSG